MTRASLRRRRDVKRGSRRMLLFLLLLELARPSWRLLQHCLHSGLVSRSRNWRRVITIAVNERKNPHQINISSTTNGTGSSSSPARSLSIIQLQRQWKWELLTINGRTRWILEKGSNSFSQVLSPLMYWTRSFDRNYINGNRNCYN